MVFLPVLVFSINGAINLCDFQIICHLYFEYSYKANAGVFLSPVELSGIFPPQLVLNTEFHISLPITIISVLVSITEPM